MTVGSRGCGPSARLPCGGSLGADFSYTPRGRRPRACRSRQSSRAFRISSEQCRPTRVCLRQDSEQAKFLVVTIMLLVIRQRHKQMADGNWWVVGGGGEIWKRKSMEGKGSVCAAEDTGSPGNSDTHTSSCPVSGHCLLLLLGPHAMHPGPLQSTQVCPQAGWDTSEQIPAYEVSDRKDDPRAILTMCFMPHRTNLFFTINTMNLNP